MNPTTKWSTFGDTGHHGNGLKTNLDDLGESDTPTGVERDGRT